MKNDITTNYLYAELLKTVIDFLECVESCVRNDKLSHVSALSLTLYCLCVKLTV